MASQGRVCIAVDFGGTKLLLGALRADGTILASETCATGFQKQHEAASFLLAHLDDFIRARSWGRDEVACVGMGLVGQIDYHAGVWHKMYGLPDDGPIAVAQIARDRYGVPCTLDNDVKAALMAERRLGVGRERENFAYINVGTGIAAGIVCDGKVIRGYRNDAGEIGHYVVRLREAAEEEQTVCVEALASGGGMLARFKALAAREGEPDGREPVHTANLFELADAGDPLARRVTDDAAAAIGDLLVNAVASYAPQTIVFGGGVFHDGWMLKKVMERLPERIKAMEPEICVTTLDIRTIGLVGAAMLGFAGEDEGGKRQ